jgi:eukaryotic-like serine/threonine-protein kinase
MNKARFLLLLLLSALLIFVAIRFSVRASALSSDPILGTWSGELKYGGETQKMTLRFELDEKKTLVVFFSQPEMKFYNLGPGPVEKKGEDYSAPPLTFRLAPGEKKISGTMSFDGNELTLDLRPATAPSPAPPSVAEITGRVAQPLWTFKTGGAIWSSPAVDRGTIYFGSNDGSIFALKAHDGKLLWQTRTGGWVMGRPTLSGEYLYALSDDGFLYKLQKETGKTLWKFDTHGGSVKRQMPNPPDNLDYDYFTSGAAVVEDTVYVGSADKNLYAVDAETGQEKWHFATNDIVRSTPSIAAGIVFFGSRDHDFYAVDAGTGALKWKYDTLRKITSSPLVVGDVVYVGSRCSDLFAFDAVTGKVRWKFFYWSSWVESSASIRDGILYIGSSDYQQLLAIDATSGVWNFDTDGSAWSTPAVTDKLVYVGAVGIPHLEYIDHHGAFFAVDRATGKIVWRYPMSEIPDSRTYGVASSPAVDHGLVFFGGLDGTFYAFRQGG